MKKDKPKAEIAYLCTGKDRTCEKTGCFFKNHGPCMHTMNPRYARNGVETKPEKHPERFEKFKANCGGQIVIRYYERSNQDDQSGAVSKVK